MTEAARAAERAARSSYGRLLAFLAARSRDLAAAEDALADAFAAALAGWPRDGVPATPEAWLLTHARRRLIDRSRRERTARAGEAVLLQAAEEVSLRSDVLPDRRLELLLACTHPAIDAGARTPLMLQVVLGLDAARIASAFLVAPSAMGQRLVRAKTKIRDAGVPFTVPDAAEWPDRIGAVLDAIYAAYGAAWEDATSADPHGLAEETLFLARLVVDLVPAHAEALGLLALLLHCESRRPARRTPGGRFVPLCQQDVSRWDQGSIAEAERALEKASSLAAPGRYQLEAAIQSVHAGRLATGRTDWPAVALLYEGLVRLAPTVGAQVARAAALLEAVSPEAALAALQPLEADDYQPLWVVRAEALARLGRTVESTDAFTRALGLTEDPAVRAYLQGKLLGP